MKKPSTSTVLQLIAFIIVLAVAALLIFWEPTGANDLTTKPKVVTIQRPTLITLFSVDGTAQPVMQCTKVTKSGDWTEAYIDIETEVGTLRWKGSYLIVDQDKLDAAEAKADAATHGIHRNEMPRQQSQFPDSNQTGDTNTSKPELAPTERQ